MAEIVPFHGLRYDEQVVGDLARVIAPPYDVISPERQDELYASSPHNIVRVELTRERSADDPALDKYDRAKRTLAEWIEQGALKVDFSRAFYLYDHYFSFRGERVRRRGFFGALRLYEWGRGVVRPHEQTFSGPKLDRLRLLRATRTNTSPVFVLYDDPDNDVRRFLDNAIAHGPAELVADARQSEERHLLLRLADTYAATRLAELFAEKRLYIADGHHRYETALEYWREEQRAGRLEVENDTPTYVFAYFVAMQDPGLIILPTHRVLRGAQPAVEAVLERGFARRPVAAGALEDEWGELAVARDGTIESLEPRSPADLERLPATWRELAVAQAEELIVKPAREAGAEVSYTHDTAAALEAARAGAVSVLLRAVTPQTIQRVADAWERLPQKTTYFYPKVPTGLVLRPLGE